jgi:hypothetical protein
MAIALAQIAAAFDDAAAINDFKLRVERFLRLGPQHPLVRARFGARAAMLSGHGLAGALAVTERRWRDETAAFHLASAFGRGERLTLDVLRELRLILRWMRARGLHVEFGAIAGAVCGDGIPMAAE